MDNLSNKKIAVIGLGYIGLPTASLLATKGYNVLGVDISQHVVDTINRGDIHIEENDLDVLVKSAVNSGQLQASLTPESADIFIIAVPTPFKDNYAPDLSCVESAVKAIAPVIKAGNLIILESTSPVGTTTQVAEWLRELRPDLRIPSENDTTQHKNQHRVFIAYCPERVLPGQIIRELMDNDRIIGGVDSISAKKAHEFYQTFVQGQLLLTNARTAEMTKLTENAFRDVNIAFANELSLICEELNINVWELIKLANHHPRVDILQPGPGVGGHCIAVDPWFIVHRTPKIARIIRIAREVNSLKPQHIVAKIKQQAARFKQPVIACFGLSFKADVDDVRESPAVEIVEQLAQDHTGQLLVADPHVKQIPDALAKFSTIEFVSVDQALLLADIVVLLVNHIEFAAVNRSLLSEKIVIDTRGMWQ